MKRGDCRARGTARELRRAQDARRGAMGVSIGPNGRLMIVFQVDLRCCQFPPMLGTLEGSRDEMVRRLCRYLVVVAVSRQACMHACMLGNKQVHMDSFQPSLMVKVHLCLE